MAKRRWITAALIVLAILSIHPATRYYIWLILPLGSGPDDMIVGAILVVIAAVAAAHHITNDKKIKEEISKLFNAEEKQ
ncbi:hypothetical protein AGMMS49992_12070 [Clostridia bacterium]|nr:hypothetical protein AGMMS49992_12070 [Clostridia bacterium]